MSFLKKKTTMAKWIKNNNYGDYRDPVQNHKDCYGNRRQASIIAQVRRLSQVGKHVGSKSLNVLLKHLKNQK